MAKTKFTHYFHPMDRQFNSEEEIDAAWQSWEEILKESYKQRKPHSHEKTMTGKESEEDYEAPFWVQRLYRTEPKVITKAELEDGRVDFAFCSDTEKFWHRKRGNKIALVRAERRPVPVASESE